MTEEPITRAERIAGGVLVALATIMLTLLGSFLVPLRVSGTPIPLAHAVALVGNAALPWLMVRATESRGLAVLPLMVWLIVAFVATSSGPGGDVLIEGNGRGLAFLVAGTAGGVLGMVLVTAQTSQRKSDDGRQTSEWSDHEE